MALSKICQLRPSFPVTAFLFFFFLFFSLTFLPPRSAGMEASSVNDVQPRKEMVLGSRPPTCVNKCLSCRPCQATLLIPPHQGRIKKAKCEESSHREDGNYYLLSWKCRCGDKLYGP